MILYNDFYPFTKEVWGASDTETFTYIDGVKVSNDELLRMAKKEGFNLSLYRR